MTLDGQEVRLHATEVEGSSTIDLVLDRRTAFPKRFEMIAAGRPMATVTYSNVAFLKSSQVPDGTFDYRPPAGARVTDLR